MKALSFVNAFLLSWSGSCLHERTASLKRALFTDLSGVVIEIGSGSGVNLPLMPHGVCRYIGVEPNPFLREDLRGVTTSPPLAIEAVDGAAEHLPFPDNFADAVISTFVLCSVRDQKAALGEALRVLKPGGKFVFLEHIASPKGSLGRRLQTWLSPLSCCCCGGCHSDRDTGIVIHDAAFTFTQIAMTPPLRFLSAPIIAGYAIK